MESLRLDLSNQNLAIDDLNTNNPTASFANSINTNHPASTNDFCEATNPNATCVNQILFNTNNINRNLDAYHDTNDDHSSWCSYGVYYNWYTATAGHGSYSVSTAGATVEGDICPANWRLPTGGSDGEFGALNTAINNGRTNTDVNLRNYPNNLIYSGDYNKTVLGGRSTYGRLWSSTVANANNAYRLGFTSGEVTPIKNYNKWDAFAIRCIVK